MVELTDCQPPRQDALINIKVHYFSGDHEGHSGIFALLPKYFWGTDWISDLNQDKNLFNPYCYPPDALRTAINGGHYPGPNCTYEHEWLSYRGTGISDFGVSGVNWTGWCDEDYQFRFYESRIGADCSGKPGYLYACDSQGFISELTPLYQWTLQDSCDCKAIYDLGRWQNRAFSPNVAGVGEGVADMWVFNSEPDWDASNNGTGYREGPVEEPWVKVPPTQVYWTGAGCWTREEPATRGMYRGEWDETKVFAIVATGGGGPGAGDNIPPYWSDTECDWIYAIREVVAGDCTDLGSEITGCPTGPIIQIGLTKLHDAWCANKKPYDPCPGIDWICCLSGTGDAPGTSGYCTAIYNRGPIYPNGDYVCYADGTGNVPGASGPYWIVNSDSNWDGITGVACNWTYDLQYYNPYIPGPSGALQTGILESAISTGCVINY
jgi:hypothetical protein